MHRVEELADRPEGFRPAGPHPFHSLIPLPELLGEVYGVGASSKQVQAEYFKLLVGLGSELSILRETPLDDITKIGGERLAAGIGRMRRGEVVAQPGYDGEYGVIRVFAATRVAETQMGLFGDESVERGVVSVERKVEGEAVLQEWRSSYETAYEQAEAVTIEVAPRSTLPAPRLSELAPRSTLHHPLLDGLNPEQRAAVLCTDAPLVIVAGPGTGKTRTLTVRIAHLILEGQVAPESVLAITFTNKAAGEMQERLSGLLGNEIAGRVTIKTFHAFGAMLLRQHAERLDLSPEFVILAEEDRAALLRQACPELKQAEVAAALAQISAAKNEATGTRINTDDADRVTDGNPCISASIRVQFSSDQYPGICRRYEAALRASDAVDFDDLILLPIRLLEEHPELLAATQARYHWISVDEYQDVNAAQYRLLRLLAGEGVNLCVIGDPDQAIYSFRGADRRYFLQFEQDYPGAVTLNLSRNYRSSQRILDAAGQVIARNPDRKSVEILAEFADEVKLDVYRAPDRQGRGRVRRPSDRADGGRHQPLFSGLGAGDG